MVCTKRFEDRATLLLRRLRRDRDVHARVLRTSSRLSSEHEWYDDTHRGRECASGEVPRELGVLVAHPSHPVLPPHRGVRQRNRCGAGARRDRSRSRAGRAQCSLAQGQCRRPEPRLDRDNGAVDANTTDGRCEPRRRTLQAATEVVRLPLVEKDEHEYRRDEAGDRNREQMIVIGAGRFRDARGRVHGTLAARRGRLCRGVVARPRFVAHAPRAKPAGELAARCEDTITPDDPGRFQRASDRCGASKVLGCRHDDRGQQCGQGHSSADEGSALHRF